MRTITKVLRDLWLTRGRVLFMALSLAAGLTSMGAVLSMRTVLLREMARNYQESVPASATIDVGEKGISDSLLEELRGRKEVAAAERRAMREGRWRLPGQEVWGRALIFVIEDFENQKLALIEHETGEPAPARDTVLVERSALKVLSASNGDVIEVATSAGSRVVEMKISGVVHEPALAPAITEQAAYLYITKETWAGLGGAPVLNEVRILVAENPLDVRAVEAQAKSVAAWLGGRGVEIHDIRIPPPGEHPHEAPSQTVLLLFAIFSGLTVLLSGVLSASLLTITMARQVREIAVMKTIGATSARIGRLYVLMLGIVSLLAITVSFLPTWAIGRLGIDAVAELLNLDIGSYAVPLWVPCFQVAVGIALPLLTAAPAILGATRVSVQAALNDYGAGAPNPRVTNLFRHLGNRLVRAALLSAIRVKGRFALTLTLLAMGGALFIMAVSLADSWEGMTEQVFETRHYDVELHLAEPLSAQQLKQLDGVERIEVWGSAPATIASPSGLPLSHTYPDGGHGSFHMVAVPDETTLIDFALRAGRWLSPGESDGVVLNQLAAARVGKSPLGREIGLVVEGNVSTWKVIGIVDEVAAPAIAYVSQQSFRDRTGERLRTLRVSADPGVRRGDTPDVVQRIVRDITALGGGVVKAVPLQLLYNAMGEHVVVLIRSLIALSVLMAFVGILALGSTMSTNVVERTRELGVLQAVGARPAQIQKMVIIEGWFLSFLSLPLALLLAVPLTAQVAGFVGELSFKLPLPLDISWLAVGLWSLGILIVSTFVSALPARTAAKLSVVEALSHV